MARVLLIVEPNTKLDKLLNKMSTAYKDPLIYFEIEIGV